MKAFLIAVALALSMTAGCVSTAPRAYMKDKAPADCTLGDDELLRIALYDPSPTNRLQSVRCLSNDLFKAKAVLGETSDRQVRLAAIEGLHSQDVINLLGRYCLPFDDTPNILTHDRWSDAALRIKRIVNSPWMQKRVPGASVHFKYQTSSAPYRRVYTTPTPGYPGPGANEIVNLQGFRFSVDIRSSRRTLISMFWEQGLPMTITSRDSNEIRANIVREVVDRILQLPGFSRIDPEELRDPQYNDVRLAVEGVRQHYASTWVNDAFSAPQDTNRMASLTRDEDIAVAAMDFSNWRTEDILQKKIAAMTNQSLLAAIVVDSRSAGHRLTAARTLADQQHISDCYSRLEWSNRVNWSLATLSMTESALADIRDALVKRSRDTGLLTAIACEDRRGLARSSAGTAVEALTDPTALTRIAVSAPHAHVRESAVQKLPDKETLVQVAIAEDYETVAIQAVYCIVRQSILATRQKDWMSCSPEEKVVRIAADRYPWPDQWPAGGKEMARAAVANPADQSLIERIALGAKRGGVRKYAVGFLTSMAAVEKVLASEQDAAVLAAAEDARARLSAAQSP
ncbi:MAG TPA: hypothetical protein PLE77_11845 [Kiritimatiellia bacterium]|nr:hypothetical protein [Kiritimatiellia bacterium]